MAQDKKINEYKKNPTVDESAYVVGLNSNDENINIPRATLAEIVRQELYSILNASAAAQGTTVTKVPVLGGNRIGSSSIADLAAVLGAQANAPLTSADLNDISITCIASAGQNETENMPTTTNYYIVPTFVCRRGFRFQLAAQIMTPYKLFFRTYNPSNQEAVRWSAWREITIVQ